MEKELIKIIKSKELNFDQMLNYMKQYKKYDNVTYRDLDKAFKNK